MGPGERLIAPEASHRLTCTACQASNDVPAAATKFVCTACGKRNLIFGCDHCGGAQVAADSHGKSRVGWTCYWCLEPLVFTSDSRLRRGGRGKATAADVSYSLEEHGLTGGDSRVIVVGGFEVIAGSGECPPAGSVCSIAALAEGVLVVSEIRHRGHIYLRYPELVELEAGGQGMLVFGPRFIGGGRLGVPALVGMAVARALTNATRKTALDSFLRVTATDTELLLRHWHYEPATVRGMLSRMFTAQLAAARTATPPVIVQAPAPPPTASTPLDELERLTKLHAAGTLTDTEFELARAKQIKSLQVDGDG